MPMSVKGELFPSNIEPNPFAYRWLCENFMQDEIRRQQYLTKKSLDKWEWQEEEGFPVYLQYKAEGVYGDAPRVINYIDETIHSPIGAALDLRGYLNIILEGRSGLSIFNMHITDEGVLYREGYFSFLPPVTMPERSLETNLMTRDIEEEDSNVSPLLRKFR